MSKLIFFLFLCGLIFIVYLKQSEIVENHYQAYTNLIESGDLSNGWINKIPESSTNITEYHNIDTNEVWINFSHINTYKSFASCKKIDEIKVGLLPHSYPNTKWKSTFKDNLAEGLKFKCEESLVVIKNMENFSHVMIYRKSEE